MRVSPSRTCDSSSSGSVGHSSDFCEWDNGHESQRRFAPCATVLLNGIQLLRCVLPPAGQSVRVESPAGDVNVSGSRGCLPLDVLYVVPHRPAGPGNEWHATLAATVELPEGQVLVHDVSLGAVHQLGGSTHTSHVLPGRPISFSVSVAQTEVCARSPPIEQQLVKEVAAILENPRLNRERGSLSSVLINNKAKESVLYDKVVGSLYNKSWSDFLKAHVDDFTVFYYNDAEIRERALSPHIKRSDARVCLASRPRTSVCGADQLRCDGLRGGEEGLKHFLMSTLSQGEVSQRDLLARLKHCKGFTDSLYPTFSLLMRFLVCHGDAFTWASDPDQPARIGVRRPGSYAHHSTPDMFFKLGAQADAAAEAAAAQPPAYTASPSLVLCSDTFYGSTASCGGPHEVPDTPTHSVPNTQSSSPWSDATTSNPAPRDANNATDWANKSCLTCSCDTYRHDPYGSDGYVVYCTTPLVAC